MVQPGRCCQKDGEREKERERRERELKTYDNMKHIEGAGIAHYGGIW
jgi:hypothetical protein